MSIRPQKRGLWRSLLPSATGHIVSSWPQPAGHVPTSCAYHPTPCPGPWLSSLCHREVNPEHPIGHDGALWQVNPGRPARPLTSLEITAVWPPRSHATHPPTGLLHALASRSSSSSPSSHVYLVSLGHPSSGLQNLSTMLCWAVWWRHAHRGPPRPTPPPSLQPGAPPGAQRCMVLIPSQHTRAPRTTHNPSHTHPVTPAHTYTLEPWQAWLLPIPHCHEPHHLLTSMPVPCNPPASLCPEKITEICSDHRLPSYLLERSPHVCLGHFPHSMCPP